MGRDRMVLLTKRTHQHYYPFIGKICALAQTHTHTSKRERAQKKTKKKYLYKCNLNNQSVLTRNGVEVFSAMYCGFSDLKRLKFDDKALFIKCKTSE